MNKCTLKWTPEEQRVFELLTMRRHEELIEFCKKLLDKPDNKSIWR